MALISCLALVPPLGQSSHSGCNEYTLCFVAFYMECFLKPYEQAYYCAFSCPDGKINRETVPLPSLIQN